MAISSLSAISTDTTNPLLAKLEANGLSADKAQVVEDDLSDVLSQGSGSGPVDVKSVRAALDQKIDQDVASGKLSESDAAAVKKTLDDLDAQASGTGTSTSQTQSTDAASSDSTGSTQSSSASAGASGAKGGGGGSAAKTEASESTTISGSLKVTTITYTDGSTVTTTTAASPDDLVKYGTKAQQTASADTASKYLSTIQPGSLFQLMA